VKMRANDDGAGHKAVLLSGPPGIGKTSTAQIVCKVRQRGSSLWVLFEHTLLCHRPWNAGQILL